LPGSQTVSKQHPAHDVSSQVHAASEQYCPLEHAAAPPQVHTPWSGSQPSPDCPHGLHAWPFVPHAAILGVAHVPSAAQQPVGHDSAVQMQAPLEQTWPASHAAD
jgi:hypothetical protein